VTAPFLCVFFALLLTWGTKIPLGIAMRLRPGGYDNKHPRRQQSELEGWGERAHAAHANGFESFAPFAAGVVIAHLAGLDEHRATILSVTFVVARLIYPVCYIANLDYLRTAVWSVGFLATGALYVLPWWTG
jgi:uncharacterized MAPEG superfamily protein